GGGAPPPRGGGGEGAGAPRRDAERREAARQRVRPLGEIAERKADVALHERRATRLARSGARERFPDRVVAPVSVADIRLGTCGKPRRADLMHRHPYGGPREGRSRARLVRAYSALPRWYIDGVTV